MQLSYSHILISPTTQISHPRPHQKNKIKSKLSPKPYHQSPETFLPPISPNPISSGALISFFLHSFSPTQISPTLTGYSHLSSEMTSYEKGKAVVPTNQEDVCLHVRLLEEAFQEKLKLPPPVSKRVSMPSEMWEDLESKGKKLLAIKILTDEILPQGAAFDAVLQALQVITNDVALTISKNLIYVATFGKESHLLAFVGRSPWLVFRNKLLLLKKIDHLTVASKVKFTEAEIWVNILEVPEGLSNDLWVRQLLVGCAGRVLGDIQVHPAKGDWKNQSKG